MLRDLFFVFEGEFGELEQLGECFFPHGEKAAGVGCVKDEAIGAFFISEENVGGNGKGNELFALRSEGEALGEEGHALGDGGRSQNVFGHFGADGGVENSEVEEEGLFFFFTQGPHGGELEGEGFFS